MKTKEQDEPRSAIGIQRRDTLSQGSGEPVFKKRDRKPDSKWEEKMRKGRVCTPHSIVGDIEAVS